MSIVKNSRLVLLLPAVGKSSQKPLKKKMFLVVWKLLFRIIGESFYVKAEILQRHCVLSRL